MQIYQLYINNGNQFTRSDTYRKNASQTTEDNLAFQLKNKLFPGVKDGQSASDRLEAYNTERAITLTVTTRAIGFSCYFNFQAIFEFEKVLISGDIHYLYRIGLIMAEATVIIANRSVRQIQDVTEDYQRSALNILLAGGEEDAINSRDKAGRTALYLAVAYKFIIVNFHRCALGYIFLT